jgi:hypothetical protein
MLAHRKQNSRKKTDLTFGEIVIANCPMTTAARSVAVTFPGLKPATLIGPIQNPSASASAKKIASSHLPTQVKRQNVASDQPFLM